MRSDMSKPMEVANRVEVTVTAVSGRGYKIEAVGAGMRVDLDASITSEDTPLRSYGSPYAVLTAGPRAAALGLRVDGMERWTLTELGRVAAPARPGIDRPAVLEGGLDQRIAEVRSLRVRRSRWKKRAA